MKLTSLILIGIIATSALAGKCAHWSWDGTHQICVKCYESKLVSKGPWKTECVGDKPTIKWCRIQEIDTIPSQVNKCTECQPGYTTQGSSSSVRNCVKEVSLTGMATISHMVLSGKDATQTNFIPVPKSCLARFERQISSNDATNSPECKALLSTDKQYTVPNCLGYVWSTGLEEYSCEVCKKGYYKQETTQYYKLAASDNPSYKTNQLLKACIKIPKKFIGCDIDSGIIKGRYCQICDYKNGWWSKGPVKGGNLGWGLGQICTDGSTTIGESTALKLVLTSFISLLLFVNI